MSLPQDRILRTEYHPCRHTHSHTHWSGCCCCHTNKFHCSRYNSSCSNRFRSSRYNSSSSLGTHHPFDSTGAPHRFSFASSIRHRWRSHFNCPIESKGSQKLFRWTRSRWSQFPCTLPWWYKFHYLSCCHILANKSRIYSCRLPRYLLHTQCSCNLNLTRRSKYRIPRFFRSYR